MLGGIISGISKVFAPVGQSVVKIGKAVTGVGAATFTAGAATGAKSIASGGLSGVASSMGGGVLGSVLAGAIKQATVGALIGGGIGALTGAGFGKGALIGGLGGALTGGIGGAMQGNGLMPAAAAPGAQAGLTPASTATGVAPTGVTGGDLVSSRVASAHAVTAGNGLLPAGAPAATAGGGGGLLGFLGSETGGHVISGLGQGAMGWFQAKEAEKARQLQAEEYDKQRADEMEREMRLQDSYKMGDGAYFTPPAADGVARPTPAQAYGRTKFVFSPDEGRIISVPA